MMQLISGNRVAQSRISDDGVLSLDQACVSCAKPITLDERTRDVAHWQCETQGIDRASAVFICAGCGLRWSDESEARH